MNTIRRRDLGVPGRSQVRDTSKMKSCLDKSLNFERRPCEYLGEEDLRQREEQMQRSPGETVLHVFQEASAQVT